MTEHKFKVTEAGLIPNEWETTSIENIKASSKNAFVDGPFGSNLKSVHFVKHGDVFVIESSCVTSGTFIPREYKTITKEHFETISRSECSAGDVIIAKIGMNCGMCAELPKLSKRSVVSGNSMKITINQEKMLNYIFISYMNQAKKEGRFDSLVSESAQPALSLRTLNTFIIPKPPLSEQKKIAEALFDVEEMLETLDKLIEKKKFIKQGIMQDLFSNKTRLQGFYGKWENKAIIDITGKIKRGQTLKSNDFCVGNIPVVAGGKQYAGFHNVANQNGRTITISGSGASAGYVLIHNTPIFATDCSVIKEMQNFSLDFLYYYLSYLQETLYGLQTGGAQPHVYPRDIERIKINIPSSKEEQEAISKILIDVDEEISILETRLTKYKAIHQGMVQQLLKGKIRLV